MQTYFCEDLICFVGVRKNLIDREAIFCKDLQDQQKLQGIRGSNNSRQYEIILQTNEGPDLLEEANVVQDIISKSPLLLHKDVVDFFEQIF